MYEEKFKEVKYDDVVDKYGYVVNLDLAKYLIYLTYCDDRDSYVQDWVSKCQSSLEQIDGDEFYLRDPDTNRLCIGGPGGYSGYMFQEFNKYCEDEFPEDEPERWGIGMEEQINSYPLVFVIIENKPRLFIKSLARILLHFRGVDELLHYIFFFEIRNLRFRKFLILIYVKINKTMNIISYKFRLYPTKEQEKYFTQCFGNSRFLWNKMLEDSEKHYKDTGKFLNIKSYLPYKRWFFDNTDSTLCSNVWKYFKQSYKNFFKSGFGKPKFKSKKSYKDSYTTNNVNNSIRIEGNKIKLPKIGWVKLKVHRKLEGTIKNATISKDNVGNYYISLICETSKNFILGKVYNNKSIGIDLGIKDLYTDSNGNKISNPKYRKKSLKKIRKLQKNLSRKHKGSKNYEKARLKLAKSNKKVENQRKDYLHKESKKLINDNQVICLESLSINEICSSKKSNSNFRRASYDAGLGMFISMLVYKSKLYGRTIKTVDKYFPSSQVCSSCGELHPEMKNLNNRTLVCKSCGIILDRDTNAAINILNNAK